MNTMEYLKRYWSYKKLMSRWKLFSLKEDTACKLFFVGWMVGQIAKSTSFFKMESYDIKSIKKYQPIYVEK